MIPGRLMGVATLYALLSIAPAHAEVLTICTVVADAATAKTLRQEGACDTRATAASTFKIPISLMGYDAAFLVDTKTPALPFKEGYPDWIPAWRSTTDPSKWMKDSVVWYSQQITRSIGKQRFGAYVKDFQYGNMDVSGDPGKDNGLTRSWLSSSLEISPIEQLAFLRKVVLRELPIQAHAYDMTEKLVDIGAQPSGWHVFGKTGSGPSKGQDGRKVSGQPWGWFVGWATKGERTIVFARLTKGRDGASYRPGPAARDAILRDLFASPEGL